MADTAESPFILVVEDDPLLSDLIARKFSDEKIEMEYAPTGEIALELLGKERKPDLVLLDIRLPGIDGFEVLRHIRSDPATKGVRVIIFSNFGEDADIAKAKELGADKFVVKVSLSLDEVVDLVRSAAAGA
ncbi:MAG TPA: response regulator [Candidatus Paceibacterota bacterium]|nr:response regulator [Candidatus Paceibacterota bacterium]